MRATTATHAIIGTVTGLGAAFLLGGCKPGAGAGGANPSEGPSTGVPAEVAEPVDAITERLEADAFPGAQIRAKDDAKPAESFATRSTGVPDEVAEAYDRIHGQLEADAFSEAGIRVKRVPDDQTEDKRSEAD